MLRGLAYGGLACRIALVSSMTCSITAASHKVRNTCDPFQLVQAKL